jgi:hypothetical protein
VHVGVQQPGGIAHNPVEHRAAKQKVLSWSTLRCGSDWCSGVMTVLPAAVLLKHLLQLKTGCQSQLLWMGLGLLTQQVRCGNCAGVW